MAPVSSWLVLVCHQEKQPLLCSLNTPELGVTQPDTDVRGDKAWGQLQLSLGQDPWRDDDSNRSCCEKLAPVWLSAGLWDART